MNILVLGGTGAMGRPLVQELSMENTVWVTSRKPHPSTGSVRYILGNAKDLTFLEQALTERHYDAIVDFMVWTTEFEAVLPMLLQNTDQYVFISSARVYSQSDEPITESTPRLLDVSDDQIYLRTNEYALAKAREEDLLRKSGSKNYTIIRPSITYNTHRLQLGVFEKEAWLYRALHGRSIVFSDDIADKLTTMTLGDDVAKGIASIVGQDSAIGETFHITYPSSLLWSDVLNVYLQVLEKHLGRKVNVVMTKKCTNLLFPARIYQVIYCRYFNRTFDNSKIGQYCDVSKFTAPEEGLVECLQRFLDSPSFSTIDWPLEALNDKAANERTPISEIPGIGSKIYYLLYRYDLQWLERLLHPLFKIKGILKSITKK